ncbi:hypothetical protein [Cupriavidus metallidurans]|uniref:Helix-turn-helix domain-containing protein n=2 Tax=Burkholderiaceae TaxID=119060 RepID=A0A482INI2_9BURK|nr:hypothetical protein [Cupriavidus metallidurans]QBP09197.1 hypothetical protein DDF84_005180 [Cupriavidus metallidurans]
MNGKKGHSEQFVKLPHRVIDSPQFLLLSGSALRLLLDLLRQYKGNNNGFLIATEARLMKRGWTSKATIASAIDEVLHSGLVKRLAEGGLNRPARYALAWIELAKAPPPIVLQKARRPRSTKRATPPKNGVVALTPENGVVPVFATPENGVVLPQKVGQPCDTGLRTTPKTGVVDGFCDTRLPQKLGRSISTKGGAVEVGEVGG